jgi:hypothetical protein
MVDGNGVPEQLWMRDGRVRDECILLVANQVFDKEFQHKMENADFCFFFGEKVESEDEEMQEDSTAASEPPKQVFQKPKPSIKVGKKPLSLMEMIQEQ